MKLKSDLSEETKKNKIKKYQNPYILFCNEQRPLLMKENPTISQNKLTLVMSDLWNSLSDIEKEPFKAKSHQEKEKFLQNKGSTEDIACNQAIEYKYIKKKTIKKPTNLRSAYNFYIQQNKKLLCNKDSSCLSNIKLIRKLSEEWNHLSDSDKASYIEMAENDKKRFENDANEYYSLLLHAKSKKGKGEIKNLLPLVEKCNTDNSLSVLIEDLSTQISKSDKPKR